MVISAAHLGFSKKLGPQSPVSVQAYKLTVVVLSLHERNIFKPHHTYSIHETWHLFCYATALMEEPPINTPLPYEGVLELIEHVPRATQFFRKSEDIFGSIH